MITTQLEAIPNLGYFLDNRYWEDAYSLEEAKINFKQNNTHFKTLNIEYFSRIDGDKRKVIGDKEYFNSKVFRNLFYGMPNEFFYKRYVTPKSIYGLRNYTFISYSLNLVHNAIGLYLLDLSSEFFDNYYSKSQAIDSFYGGKIKYQNNKINFKKKNIYYRSEYLEFRKKLTELTKDEQRKTVIRIDIQDFFDNIPVRYYLELLRNSIKYNELSKFKFDKVTINEIETFYRFVMNSKKGIPQIDNSIISSFISHTYLCFLDLELDDLFKELEYKDYNIIRYMDDIYLIFNPKNTDSTSESLEEAIDLLTRIKDLTYYKFQLKINNKTAIYQLVDIEQKKKFFKATKNISILDEIEAPIDIEETHEEKPVEIIIEEIMKQLQIIKEGGVKLELEGDEIDQNILQKIFEDKVNALLNKEKYRLRLENIFSENFNFDLVKINPLILTILVMKNVKTKDKYLKFLLEKKYLTSNDRALVIEGLRQLDFNHDPLFNLLSLDPSFSEVLELWRDDNVNLNLEYPGYFNLEFSKATYLLSDYSIIKQMELRVLNELNDDYSVALNHLVNEFQSICYNLDNLGLKNYNAKSVEDFLRKKGMANSSCIDIRNMFARRNNNLISHSGDNEAYGTPVDLKEYKKYKKAVEKCLGKLEITSR